MWPHNAWQAFYCLWLWRRNNRRVAFFITSLFLGTFGVLLPLVCRDWVYSKYHYISFKSSTDYIGQVAAMNRNRFTTSKQYLSQLNADAVLRHFKKFEENAHISLAIGIVSVNRSRAGGDSLGYLSQVVTRFMDLFDTDKYFQGKVLFICDADPRPHAEAEMLGRYVPRYRRFRRGEPGEQNRFEKEKADYVFCLKKALTYNPKYVVIIEDDAVPRPDLFQVLIHILCTLVENRYVSGDPVNNEAPWAYLKLYYPERWQGFSIELRSLAELVGCALIGGLVFLYTCWFLEKRHMTHPAYYYLVGCVYTALVAFVIGRQYLIEFRRASPSLYSVVDAPDCCSPAILYPRKMAAEVADYLGDTTCDSQHPVDLAMDKFTKTLHYKRYLVEPNLLKHIGYISSIKGSHKSPSEFIF